MPIKLARRVVFDRAEQRTVEISAMPGLAQIILYSEVLSGRVTPELRHLQVGLGAQISYRKAAALLRMFLPPMGGITHTTTRSRVHAVGERIDEQIQREIAENRKPDKPADQMIIGIDGAFVKGRRPTDRASLEIITGLIEADAEQSKVFAVVRDQDGRAKQHVQAITRQRGRGPETKIRVLSDGEDGMRSIAGKWFNANEQHILDWYHFARRFEAIGKSLIYLPHVEDFEYRLLKHWQHLKSRNVESLAWVKFQQRYQMRNRTLSKAVPAWEFCAFCNFEK